jgi:hercynylcysteine S-oxide lyase
MPATPFGHEMRQRHFNFVPGYRPLNHGSYGVSPKAVLEYQQQLRLEAEASPDMFIRHINLDYLEASRVAIANMLGVESTEVVFVPNATTGTNTVLRNLAFDELDTVIHFNTIFGASVKTLENLQESNRFQRLEVNITYPIGDDEILKLFHLAVEGLRAQGRKAKLAMFDTVSTFPGVLFPWEMLVQACKTLGIISLIDGAHGIGHISLRHLGQVCPDFFITNCYKYEHLPTNLIIPYLRGAYAYFFSTTTGG